MSENTNNSTTEVTATYPRVCYWVNEVDSVGGWAVSRVREDETGHYKYTRLPESWDLAAAKAEVTRWNAEIGLTEDDTLDIVTSSMFPVPDEYVVVVGVKVRVRVADWMNEYGSTNKTEALSEMKDSLPDYVEHAVNNDRWFAQVAAHLGTVEFDR